MYSEQSFLMCSLCNYSLTHFYKRLHGMLREKTMEGSECEGTPVV